MPRETKTARIAIRLTPSQFQAIKVLADAEGKSVAEMVREAVAGLAGMAQLAAPKVGHMYDTDGSPEATRAFLELMTVQVREMGAEIERVKAQLAERERAAS